MGSSLTGRTALCPLARHIYPYLVLVQPRKTQPCLTERLLMGCKESNQTKSLSERQTRKTQVRLLLQKQSDLGLFYTPPLKCGEVLCYTLRCLSVRPCSPFPIDNLSIYSRNFFKFCIHIVIGDEWYGIVNGKNPSIFNGVTAFFRIGKMVSGLLFLYYS